MSTNMTALEEKNAADGYGIGSAEDDAYEAPAYMNAAPAATSAANDSADTVGGQSALDLLRKRTAERVSRKVVIDVPDRPGVGIEVEAYIEAREMREWTKVSRLNKNRPASDDNIDSVRMGARALAAKATGIIVESQRLIDADSGDSLTFLDASVRSIYGATNPWDAVRALVGTDPGVLTMFQALMEESGYANSADVTEGN